MKSIFNLDNLFATGFILASLYLVSFVKLPEFLEPIEATFENLDISDIAFSKFRDLPGDTNIVIVNMGLIPRQGIADQIKIINQYKPKVIGIDVFFRNEKGFEEDTPLQDAFSEVENLVLVSKVWNYNEETGYWDTLETSHSKFNQYASTGFANLVPHRLETSRVFRPIQNLKDRSELHFAVKIAQIYNPRVVDKLLSRENTLEVINYRGNKEFYKLDVLQIFDTNQDLSFLKDKIVLMGFMGRNFSDTSWHDKLFTPLNPEFVGRSYPDMYGVVIHANIISMIVNGDFIEKKDTLSMILSIILCFFNVAFFSYIYKIHRQWYDGTTFLIGIVETVVIFFCSLFLFYYFAIKVNVTFLIVAFLLMSNLLEVYYSVFKNIAISVKRKFF